MASIQSNLFEIRQNLNELGQCMNLRRRPKGSSRRVGDELLDIVAVAIEQRTRQRQQDPSGRTLAKLRPATIARKLRLGYPLTIGVETGEMLDLEQIRGEQVITADSATMTYGLDAETRAKADRFQEGNARQAPREFYDVGREGERLVDAYVEDEIIAPYLRDLGA
jgi:hypothetical protein